MPFKPADNPKCPKCGKSVYAAEERVAGGHKFHKQCFKCGMCGKMLDSTNCAEHESELYCKNCHGRKYGPKGYGFGGGAGCLSMDTGAQFQGESTNGHFEPKPMSKAPEGEGCPRCGGYVYMAEQMLARGRGYHRRCFKCLVCNRTLDSTIHCDGPDKEIYCRGNACVPADYLPDWKSYVCVTPSDAYHKGCFKCGECKKGLDSVNCCEGPDRNIYCKGCYASRFGSRGYGHSGISSLGLMSDARDLDFKSEFAPKPSAVDTSAIKASPGQGCPRCGGVVFAAEQVLSKGREWHRKCYKCRDCSKTLDSIIACDGPDRDVYCKTCYGKKWGPHGYGFACGSGFLQTDCMTEDQLASQKPMVTIDTTVIKAPAGQGCPRCGGMVFAAEQQLAKGTMWHKKCFNCNECHRPLDSMIACDGPDREIHCRACYGKLFGPKGFGFGHTPTLVSTDVQSAPVHTEAKPADGPKAKDGKGCTRCGYAVYEAEKMLSKNRIWHKRCFSCFDCHKSLDSTNLNDGPNGEIYCRGCYGRNYGPRGVGFGMGAGTLTMA